MARQLKRVEVVVYLLVDPENPRATIQQQIEREVVQSGSDFATTTDATREQATRDGWLDLEPGGNDGCKTVRDYLDETS